MRDRGYNVGDYVIFEKIYLKSDGAVAGASKLIDKVFTITEDGVMLVRTGYHRFDTHPMTWWITKATDEEATLWILENS